MEAADILTCDDYEYPEPKPVSLPIFQTSLFSCSSVEELLKNSEDEYRGLLYSRGNNPTVMQVEERLAALEHGEKAKLVSSGVSAISGAILSCVKSGDHIICSDEAYSWAKYICQTYLARFNVSVTFVDTTKTANIENAITPSTRVIYVESPSTMCLSVSDLRAISQLARRHGILTICDNTWATPIYQNPIDLGIDIVVHSCSKYLGGHSDLVGGVIISTNKIIEHIFKTEFLPIGTVPDAHQAWLIQRGMRTLHVRLPYHYSSALKFCDYLYSCDYVDEVLYPMHPQSKWHPLAREQMRGGSGLLSARLKPGNHDKAIKAVNSLRLFRIGCSWGGYESLVYPSFANRPESRLLRIHVGLENPDSLIADFDRSFKNVLR